MSRAARAESPTSCPGAPAPPLTSLRMRSRTRSTISLPMRVVHDEAYALSFPGDQLLRVEELACRSPCAPRLRGDSGRAWRTPGPPVAGSSWTSPSLCLQPAPLPARGQVSQESPRTHTPTCHFRLREGPSARNKPQRMFPKDRSTQAGSPAPLAHTCRLHPGRPWDGPATLDGCRPDCPGYPVAWVSRLWGDWVGVLGGRFLGNYVGLLTGGT